MAAGLGAETLAATLHVGRRGGGGHVIESKLAGVQSRRKAKAQINIGRGGALEVRGQVRMMNDPVILGV